MAAPKGKRWARDFDKCQECGTTKIKHLSRGLCSTCYNKYIKENRKEIDDKKEAYKRPDLIDNKFACKFTDEEIEALCDELIEWATTSKSIHLSRFAYDKFKKSAKRLYEISRYYPKFKEAIEQAKDLIAMKITDTCWIVGDSGANPIFGEKYLPVYSQDYKDMLAWKAQLAKDKEGAEKEIIVKVVNYSGNDVK